MKEEPPSSKHHADLATWFDEFGGELVSFARRRVGMQQGEEIVQDVFVAAQGRLEKEPAPDNPRAWLFAMLRNKCIDAIRRQSTEQAAKAEIEKLVTDEMPGFSGGIWTSRPSAWAGDPAEVLERKEFWVAFDHCVDGMPLKMRQAFVLREIDGADTDTVCETLGISSNNLWVLIHRARQYLRRELGPLWADMGEGN